MRQGHHVTRVNAVSGLIQVEIAIVGEDHAGIVVIAPEGVHDDVEGFSEETKDSGSIGGVAAGGEGHDDESGGVITDESGAGEKRTG